MTFVKLSAMYLVAKYLVQRFHSNIGYDMMPSYIT